MGEGVEWTSSHQEEGEAETMAPPLIADDAAPTPASTASRRSKLTPPPDPTATSPVRRPKEQHPASIRSSKMPCRIRRRTCGGERRRRGRAEGNTIREGRVCGAERRFGRVGCAEGNAIREGPHV